MKRALIPALLSALLFSAPVRAADAVAAFPELGLRRTLFAPVGQRRILLEAPVGMCFLDPAFYGENALYKSAKDFAEDAETGTVLGVFSRCDELKRRALAAAGDEGVGEEAEDVSGPTFGIVTWLNPMAGETSDLSLEDYLDMQEAQLRDGLQELVGKDDGAPEPKERRNPDGGYAPQMLPKSGQFAFGKETRRSASGVTVAYTADISREFDKKEMAGIIGTTLAYKTPVSVMISYAPKSKIDGMLFQRMMDKMLEQHVVLNGPVEQGK